MLLLFVILFFFFNDTATTEIYTLSLHDALPISHQVVLGLLLEAELAEIQGQVALVQDSHDDLFAVEDRKSTRLNSSHVEISYAVFCLKKKKKKKKKIYIYSYSQCDTRFNLSYSR